MNERFQETSAGETHEVENQPPELCDYNVYAADRALVEGVAREGAAWAHHELLRVGAAAGSREMIELGFAANAHPPVYVSHDRFGHRIDEVRFHPAYHRLMDFAIENGLHASHWLDPRPGAQVARAAKFYLQSQVEAAHCCPVTMTSACLPTLAREPTVYDEWAARVTALRYDGRNVHYREKPGVTVGMAMTEKQGGSDVRSNSTRASALGNGGPGQAYQLVGHKYFVSAPMSDAFLVLAQAPGGLSCFLLPRWQPDGARNAMQIQRLKPKMGNVANATAEVELRGAWAVMVGDEGRGIATILEMVAMTRFDCMLGSTAGMRQAVAQATHHCNYRSAFGRRLAEQPLMQNVLADLILEHEAALAMSLRIARGLDERTDDEQAKHLVRIGTAIGKYWICKRTPGHAYEAMECIGGSGVMEDSIMPRLFRESPVNAIWEGSGNVQCLDMLRAMQREPASVQALLAEIEPARGDHPLLDRQLTRLGAELTRKDQVEYRARSLVSRMALALQGALLLRWGDPLVAEAFCRSRLSEEASSWVYGGLPDGIRCDELIERATPRLTG